MKSIGLAASLIIFLALASHAQNPITGADSTNIITTAVPFLMISPDARHAALGDAGVATSPDASSAYWNPAKLAFIKNPYGGYVSWTPWLGKIINDMWIGQLSGFYKISREQAVGVGFKYFDLGDIFFRDGSNNPLGDFNPRELAFDVTYSRMLTENLGVGLTGRYIYSNLTGAFDGVDARPGNSAAADIGVFYTKEILKGARNSELSLGASISNIGAKLSYSDNNNKDFIPTNLRLGAAYKTEIDPYNSITFIADLNKLMVPTVDEGQTLLSGMFGSFSDAPGGGSEELKEIILNLGIEYWYRDVFAARMGYFSESKDKGNRKYMTLGVGFKKDMLGVDIAYLVPTNRREHPLAETIRFTIALLQIAPNTPQESVTDQ